MKTKERRFRLNNHFVGGGLSLRKGEIVGEGQLRGYADWLVREGEIEELREIGAMVDDLRQVRKHA